MRPRSFAGLADNWGPERIGLYLKNPMVEYSERLTYTPGSKDPKKHKFQTEFFRSSRCREMLKISYDGAVAVSPENGQNVAIAKRYIREGDIIERGILRGIRMDSLDEKAWNPHVFRSGKDFLLGLPGDDRPGSPFLPSGALMMYQKVDVDYNVEFFVRESMTPGSFECDAVATRDIEIGSPLKRRATTSQREPPLGTPRYADLANMNEVDAKKFISYQTIVDQELAAKAGIPQATMHADAIIKHINLTATGRSPIQHCSRTVTLPHPMWGGYGVFASEHIRAGEVVESGFMCEINGLDGNRCPYVFTWNKNGQRHTDGTVNQWCGGGGNAPFYNSDAPSNVRMYRFHDHFRYLIIAMNDIAEGEEVMHLYASSSWRTCFVEDTYLPKVQPLETA